MKRGLNITEKKFYFLWLYLLSWNHCVYIWLAQSLYNKRQICNKFAAESFILWYILSILNIEYHSMYCGFLKINTYFLSPSEICQFRFITYIIFLEAWWLYYVNVVNFCPQAAVIVPGFEECPWLVGVGWPH